jgi:hypothetical protein
MDSSVGLPELDILKLLELWDKINFSRSRILSRQRSEVLKLLIETAFPLRDWALLWHYEDGRVWLGYKANFEIRFMYWPMRSLYEDEIRISFARAGTSFQTSDFIMNGNEECLAWIPSIDVYSFLSNAHQDVWEQKKTDVSVHVHGFTSLPEVIKKFLIEVYLFWQFDQENGIEKALTIQWPELREYIISIDTMSEIKYGKHFLPPPPRPCP